jgi:hypothetical protein
LIAASALYKKAFELNSQYPEKQIFLGTSSARGINFLVGLYDLWRGKDTSHAKKLPYKNWDHYSAYLYQLVTDYDCPPSRGILQFPDAFFKQPDFEARLNSLCAAVTPKIKSADMLVVLVHQAKGLEYDDVC